MTGEVDTRLEELMAARELFALRQARGLLMLLAERDELRGVSAFADQRGDGLLWSA
ncbi:MAG: hypothetical protein R2731_07410 [Nocardioides sp.]